MTRKRNAEGAYVARPRIAFPPLWRMAIIMVLVLLYTFAVASISVTYAKAAEERNRPSATSTWHPPLKQPGPDWAMRQFN